MYNIVLDSGADPSVRTTITLPNGLLKGARTTTASLLSMLGSY